MTVLSDAASCRQSSAGVDGVTIHYRTGWSKTFLHYSADFGATWKTIPFSTGRTSPVGPDFRVGILDQLLSPGMPATHVNLRFVLTNGAGSWDNPSASCHADFVHEGTTDYRISAPGVYVLYEGCLSRHDRTVLKTPSLALVTDIDGTLYGNELGLRRFYDLWCRQLALSGAFLIFNTGRSLESVLELLLRNRKVMPMPVAVITRVGSYIHWFRPLQYGTDPITALELPTLTLELESEWIDLGVMPPLVDTSWRESLAKVIGWDQKKCRQIVQTAIDGDALSPRGNWLDDGISSGNPFQLAVSVKADALDAVLQEIKASLADHPVKYIVSGDGDYRYLDVAISSAGKLGASLHVAKKLPGEAAMLGHAVFCGDSGNDADALQGDIKGIVVANAQPDLLKAIPSSSDMALFGVPEKFKVVIAEHPCADGIIHGLNSHGFV